MRYVNSLKFLRLNNNLTSVISMMLIFMLLSVTCLPAWAGDCETERENLRKAGEKVKEKFWNLLEKEILLAAAIATGNWYLIWKAWKAYRKAKKELEEARDEWIDAHAALKKCEEECEDDSGSTSS